MTTIPADADTALPRAVLLREVLARLGDKWTVIVICRLNAGPRRFNELKRSVEGITQRMLSATVRRLERDGLVSRTVTPTVPPQVEYALTDAGRSLHSVLYPLAEWTDEHLGYIETSRAAYDAASPPSD
ncbi:winged helix-turn-helix transcriptional regulator [Streptomyces sp. NPDC056909]|uniref:winged helix-turn-helix transcriptional regulator n=1 Tax=unclassified Streptomyces TaxID=2593676 RepID=UPI0034422A53